MISSLSLSGARRRDASAAIAPALALILLLLLGPIQSTIWNGADSPPLVRAAAPLVDAALGGLQAIAPGAEPYDVFGRFVILAYLALLAGMAALPAASHGQRIAKAALLVATIAAALGDIVAYWIAGRADDALRAVGFWYWEVPALAIALLAAAVFGALWLRANRWSGLALLLAPLLALGATLALRYMPHGPLIGLAVSAMLATRGHTASRA